MKCQGWPFPALAVRWPASTICRTMGSGIGVSLNRRTARTVRITSNVSMKFAHFLDSCLLCSNEEILFFWLPVSTSTEEKVDDAVLRRHTALRLLYCCL